MNLVNLLFQMTDIIGPAPAKYFRRGKYFKLYEHYTTDKESCKNGEWSNMTDIIGLAPTKYFRRGKYFKLYEHYTTDKESCKNGEWSNKLSVKQPLVTVVKKGFCTTLDTHFANHY